MTRGEYLLTMADMQTEAAVDAYRAGDELGAIHHKSAAEGFRAKLMSLTQEEAREEIGVKPEGEE